MASSAHEGPLRLFSQWARLAVLARACKLEGGMGSHCPGGREPLHLSVSWSWASWVGAKDSRFLTGLNKEDRVLHPALGLQGAPLPVQVV